MASEPAEELENFEAISSDAMTSDTESDHIPKIRENDHFVAIMGMSGVGKSTFVAHLTNSPVKVGHDLTACTQTVNFYPVRWTEDSTLWLLDTPGFDDTKRSDADVLKEIAKALTFILYPEGRSKLDGIIYLHRIIDIRLGNSATRNLMTFKKLCGQEALKKVILATTMWERIEAEEGERRELELQETRQFWGEMIELGSTVHRHSNNRESAMKLISHLLDVGKSHEKTKMQLSLQTELVDQGLNLAQTGAGQEVDSGLTKVHHDYTSQINQLHEDIDGAKKLHDEKLAAVLERQETEMQEKIKQVIQQQNDLKINIERLYEEKLANMQEKLEQFEKNPLARSHPVETLGRWSASMSTFGDKYWLNADGSDLATALPGIPEKCLPSKQKDADKRNRNRYIALGEKDSWYIHCRAREQGKRIEQSFFSQNFASVYPDAYAFLHDEHPNERPVCISLGTSGHYFVRTAAGCRHNLPQSVLEAVRDPQSKESLWLGEDDTWVAQSVVSTGEGLPDKYEWSAHLGSHYKGMSDAMAESDRKIRALALNPTEGEQWFVLWDGGSTRYSVGDHSQIREFDYQEWCTNNFATKWDNRNPRVGQPADPTDFALLLFARTRKRKWMPWKKSLRMIFVPPDRWRLARRNSSWGSTVAGQSA